MNDARISVIIPALDEASRIAAALLSTRAGRGVETIVVDGGSHDETVQVAKQNGATVIEALPPRGSQMNAGAQAASGDVFLFLHADSLLPAGFDAEVRTCLGQPGVVAGAFSLGIDGATKALRRVARVANWRARRLGLPYGDQAVFVPRQLFEALGRFPELPIMEDFEFARRLRRRGRVAISPKVVRTSSRRWDALGVWRTTLINQAVVLGYLAGIGPARIARWYDRAGALQSVRPVRAPPRGGVPR